MSTDKLQELENQLEALSSAIYSGEMTIKHRDRTVIYRSLDEMRRIKSDLETDIAELKNKNGTRPTSFVLTTDRNL